MQTFKEITIAKNGKELAWKSVLANCELDSMFEQESFVNANRVFYSINRTLPNKSIYLGIDKTALYEKLKSEYHLSADKIIDIQFFFINEKSKNTFTEEEKSRYGSVLFLIRQDMFVYFHPQHPGRVDLLYNSSVNENEKQKLIQMISSCPEKEEIKNHIHLVCRDMNGFRLKTFEINKREIHLKKNYNDDFLKTHETIIKRLHKENDKGLILLHGKPGTGKTTYLRHLVSLTKKRTIYIPPDLAPAIASPEFLPLLIDYPNSILIIEDAENVIEERKGGNNGAISNLLNISDGLLSDCLNIQLVCSFNTNISKIDKALLRKGRLIAKYEFRELAVEKAQTLSDSLGYKIRIEKSMTLAEIYNQSEENFNNEKSKMGFICSN